MDAGEQWHPGIIGAVIRDRLRHLDAVGPAQRKIVLAMRGRHVHEPGALLGRHEIAGQHRHIERVMIAAQRVGAEHAGKIAARMHMQYMMQSDAGIGNECRQQSQRHDQRLARLAQARVGHRIHLDARILDRRAVGQGAVAGDRPGRRRPDHHRGPLQRAARDQRKPHPDGGAGVVGIFHFGFGERSLFHHAPHHRAQAAIERAVQCEPPDFAGDRRFGADIHRRVAVRPIAENPQPLKFRRLHAEPMRGIGAAFGAEIKHRHRILVAPGFAVFFLHPPFDRQAVAIPARNVIGVVARHLPRAVDHVLQDLVQRMADMDVAVRVRRPVMQDEGRPARALRPQLLP